MMKFQPLVTAIRAAAALAMLTAVTMATPLAAQDSSPAAAGTDLLGDDFRQHWDTTGNWVQKEGVVSLQPRAGESGWSRWDAYLWSKEKYGDFQIRFEYKPEKNSNSGFYFRVADRDDPVAKGIEVQIYDSHGKADDKLTDHDSGGIIPGVPPTKNTAKPNDQWNVFEITSQDDQLTVKLNGETVNQVDLNKAPFSSRPKSGYIGFQDHALPLSLRNITIRELD